jgi:hypothetical protein
MAVSAREMRKEIIGTSSSDRRQKAGLGSAARPWPVTKKEITKATVLVAGKTIFLSTKDAATGIVEKTIQTILQLTPDELVIRDGDGYVYKMTRIHS